jgi:hypothetical protein
MANLCEKCLFYNPAFDAMNAPDYVVEGQEETETHYCLAFDTGAGIPADIWAGKVSHETPYPGDGGIQFVPDPDKLEEE